MPTPLESGHGAGHGVRGVAIARQLWRGRGLRREQGHLRGRCRRAHSLGERAGLLGAESVINQERGGAKPESGT